MDEFYGDALKKAVAAGKVPMAEIDDHARRVLRSEFAAGVVDYPVQKGVVDVGARSRRRAAYCREQHGPAA